MSEFGWVAVAVVTVLSAARLTRLATVDRFPPIRWIREKFENATDGSDWQLLTMCGYCFSFWATLAVVLWGYFTDFQTAWWLVNSVFGGSYVAAITMALDQDGSDETGSDESGPDGDE